MAISNMFDQESIIMKKHLTPLAFLITLLTLPATFKGQGNENNTAKDKTEDDKHKVVVAANAGQSLAGFVLKQFSVYANQNEVGISIKQSPALQLSGDYYVSPLFSFGAAISYQQFTLDFNKWKYLNEVTNITEIVDFRTKVTRTQIGARALLHYYNKKKLDMFSGIRFGPTIWEATTNSPDPKYEALGSLKGGSFAFQLIYFGLRGYLTDNIGLNFELAVGSPYYASAGVNCRF